jgi:hypothetical protein
MTSRRTDASEGDTKYITPISGKGWRFNSRDSTRVTRSSMMSYIVTTLEITRVAAVSSTATIHVEDLAATTPISERMRSRVIVLRSVVKSPAI